MRCNTTRVYVWQFRRVRRTRASSVFETLGREMIDGRGAALIAPANNQVNCALPGNGNMQKKTTERHEDRLNGRMMGKHTCGRSTEAEPTSRLTNTACHNPALREHLPGRRRRDGLLLLMHELVETPAQHLEDLFRNSRIHMLS